MIQEITEVIFSKCYAHFDLEHVDVSLQIFFETLREIPNLNLEFK